METRDTTRATEGLGQTLFHAAVILLMVVAVFGLIAVFAANNMKNLHSSGQPNRAHYDIRALSEVLHRYSMLNGGAYPESLEELVLPDANGETWIGRRTLPKDPWAREYRYDPPAPGRPQPRLYTFGRDDRPGGKGADADVESFLPAGG